MRDTFVVRLSSFVACLASKYAAGTPTSKASAVAANAKRSELPIATSGEMKKNDRLRFWFSSE